MLFQKLREGEPRKAPFAVRSHFRKAAWYDLPYGEGEGKFYAPTAWFVSFYAWRLHLQFLWRCNEGTGLAITFI